MVVTKILHPKDFSVGKMSKTFKIALHDGAENIPRSARRLVFNADFLKAARLCTGDIVALSSAEQGPIKVRT